MTALMLSYAADFENGERPAALAGIFKTLLFAVGLKTNFEAVGIGLLAEPGLSAVDGSWCVAGPVLSVALGCNLALLRGRQVARTLSSQLS